MFSTEESDAPSTATYLKCKPETKKTKMSVMNINFPTPNENAIILVRKTQRRLGQGEEEYETV
ncbi:hypothetical protein BSF_04550 [Bacillus subtilis]|nr:hypothetical protein BSF_04550 [Bacillus subtilis]